MVAEPKPPCITVEEYLTAERSAEVKHEYVDGIVYAMAGGSKTHGRLSARATRILDSALAGKPCRVFSSDVLVEAADRHFYPDLSISCDARDFGPGYVLHFPRVVVEVLSDSTEAYDRGRKFGYYRGSESLEEYVLVSQREALVEVYRRSTEGWLLRAWGAGETVELTSLDIRFQVDELYTDVELEGDVDAAGGSRQGM